MDNERGAAPVDAIDAERARIDSGQSRDKIAFPDPAAAPLGTDAEAGGAPPRRREVRRDAVSLTRPASPEASTERQQRLLAVMGWLGLMVLVLGLVLLVMAGR